MLLPLLVLLFNLSLQETVARDKLIAKWVQSANELLDINDDVWVGMSGTELEYRSTSS